MSGQRGSWVKDRTPFDDSKGRDMGGVVSEVLREPVGVSGRGILACASSIREYRVKGERLTFLFVSLLDDIDYTTTLSCETRTSVVKVLVKERLKLFWRGTKYWREEREKI